MKKLGLVLLAAGICLFAVSSAFAGVYRFNPTPRADLWDLDHYRYYTWGIDWNHPGETITGATLTFSNIWDWRVEPDSLYVHLLNNPRRGVTANWDFQGNGDNFAGKGYNMGTWTDVVGGRPRNFTLTYDLGALGLIDELNSYASDGVFGFGFDPDCHYFNDGLSLTVTTSQAVPEPATIALLSLGLVGAGVIRRRNK